MKNPNYNKRYLGVGLLILIAFACTTFFLNKEETSKHHVFTVFTEQPYKSLMDAEIAAFRNEQYKNRQFKVEILSETSAILEYDHHPISVLILPRKLTAKELKDIRAFRAPIHQYLFALENNNGGIKEIYLIHDSTLMGVEKSFIDFLRADAGQNIVIKEGFLAAAAKAK